MAFLTAIGEEAGSNYGCTFAACITDTLIDDTVCAFVPKAASGLL